MTKRNTRAALVKDIQDAIAPLLRPSGWRQVTGVGDSGIIFGTVMLCAYKDREPRPIDGFVVKEIYAFQDEGVMSDVGIGGALVTPWDEMPVEDLKSVLAEVGRAVGAGQLD